jgi:membrane-bound lytic murein transglycosylase D
MTKLVFGLYDFKKCPMSKIMLIAKKFALVTMLASLCSSTIIAAVHDANYSSKVTKSQLEERLSRISTNISLKYTSEVHTIVDQYIRSYRPGSERILGLTKVFFPIFDLEMSKYSDLPEEIKYLSIIESSLDVHAESHAGAVGLWQFIRSTARLQGLTVNNAVDERKDPYLSTRAAFDYLQFLHSEFGDWTLALAAYNCGPGNVRKAIRKSQSTNFWKLEKYLPQETRRYIPKFIAATYLMSYYGQHNLEPQFKQPIFERTATARIYDYTPLLKISQETGIEIGVIRDLNPALAENFIPKSQKGHMLTLPEKEMFSFLLNNGLTDNLEFTLTNPTESFEKTVVFSGFQLRKAELEMMNRMPTLVSLVKNPMQDLIKVSIIEMDRPNGEPIEGSNYEMHVLQFGESLIDIVGRHSKTTLEELIKLNNLDLNNPPKPGDLIRISKS